MKVPLLALDVAVTHFQEAQEAHREEEAFSVSVESIRGSTHLWLALKATRVVNDRLFTQTHKLDGVFFLAVRWPSLLEGKIRKLVLAVREESKK